MRAIWIIRLSANFAILLAGSILAGEVESRPEPSKSAAAVKDLEATLAKDLPLAELAQRDFAQVALTRPDADRARELLWKSHAARIEKERAGEIKERRLVDGDLTMPFFMKTFGDRPPRGHSLWISLHGGGGAPKEVNDSQWENQQRLYRLEEGIDKLIVRLDERLADLERPVQIKHQGRTLFDGLASRTIAALASSLAGRGDPQLMFSAEVTVTP